MSNSKRLVVNLSERLYDEFNAALKEDCKKEVNLLEKLSYYILRRKKVKYYI
jgi:hypothetical protein